MEIVREKEQPSIYIPEEALHRRPNSSESPCHSPVNTALERMMALDEGFASQVKEVQEHWLKGANSLLKELMEQVHIKSTSPDTKLSEVVKAIEVVSEKLNTHMGLPTSIHGIVHKHFGKPTHLLTNEELDQAILERTDRLKIVSGKK